jgi:hypothetical protein
MSSALITVSRKSSYVEFLIAMQRSEGKWVHIQLIRVNYSINGTEETYLKYIDYYGKRSEPISPKIASNQNSEPKESFSGNQVERVWGQTDFENYCNLSAHLSAGEGTPPPPCRISMSFFATKRNLSSPASYWTRKSSVTLSVVALLSEEMVNIYS